MARDTADGFVHDKFSPVREAFNANLSSGADVGAAFCATLEGETVVDIWGGFADEARTRPWSSACSSRGAPPVRNGWSSTASHSSAASASR